VYAPLSKATGMPPRGYAALGAARRAAGSMPVFALGGITAERVRELRAGRGYADLSGAAVIGAVFGADSPHTVVRSLLDALAGSADRGRD
jgi:thiamine monophosphate synthase